MRLGTQAILLVGIFAAANSIAADPPTTESIIAKSMPAIVSIRADTPGGVLSGTGFLVDPSGVVVTNLHVIEGATRVAIKLHSGEQHTQVRVASYDQERDLAILRFPGFGLPVLSLGNSDDIKVGANVLAIGNPLGLEETATTGIISSIRTNENGTRVIQTDTAVSSGNSGGPLISSSGDVIGVVTYKIRGGENINFAVPINYVRALMSFESLMSLDDFSQALNKSDVSLFVDTTSGSLTGNWKSLSNLTLSINLREEGDYLYGIGQGGQSRLSYDLKKQPDGTYRGLGRAVFTTSYEQGGRTVEFNCSTQHETEIFAATATRIEGRALATPYPKTNRKQIKFVETCGESETMNKEWADFVWVRQN